MSKVAFENLKHLLWGGHTFFHPATLRSMWGRIWGSWGFVLGCPILHHTILNLHTFHLCNKLLENILGDIKSLSREKKGDFTELLGKYPLNPPLGATLPLSTAKCPLSTAQCPLPSAQCPLPSAQCPLPSAQCPLPSAQYPLHTRGWHVFWWLFAPRASNAIRIKQVFHLPTWLADDSLETINDRKSDVAMT